MDGLACFQQHRAQFRHGVSHGRKAVAQRLQRLRYRAFTSLCNNRSPTYQPGPKPYTATSDLRRQRTVMM